MKRSVDQFSLRFLFGRTCKHGRAILSKQLGNIGLHLGQDVILRMLWEEDGQTQSELADSIRISGATLTRALQRMESAGLIERRACADDARMMRVYVADAGNNLKPALQTIWNDLDEQTFSGLTDDERVTLHNLLMKMYVNIYELE